MTAQQAYDTYKVISEHINKYWDENGNLPALEGTRIIQDWRDADQPNNGNPFDVALDRYFAFSKDNTRTNTSSDTYCTILYRGVYVNVWIHYGMAEPGCPFGFYDSKEKLNIGYEKRTDGWERLKPEDFSYEIIIKEN